jgi:hypothetical protein
VFSVLVIQEDRGTVRHAAKPGGQNIDQFKIIEDEDITAPNMAQDMESIRKPGKRDAEFGCIQIAAKILGKSGKVRCDAGKPPRGSSPKRFWWRG